jgi:Ca2+-binding EF-hand superfamily protein
MVVYSFAFRSDVPLLLETLSISDSKKSLKTLGIDAKSDEIQTFFRSPEDNSNEELDKDSFLRFAASKLIQIENAHKAFGLIDKDEKGVVVLEDLQRVAQELGENFTEEELTEMIELVDRSGDGLLRPKDFVRIARKVNL